MSDWEDCRIWSRSVWSVMTTAITTIASAESANAVA